MQHIIALGGGGFSSEPENLALDRYIIAQANKERPKVCFLPTASGDSWEYVVNFYRAYTSLNCIPSHLLMFRPHTADMAGFLLSQDIIYVGGGNTKSMLALWREWGIDQTLKQGLEQGIILAGISAGAICWFEQGSTDSIPGRYSALNCMGYLSGSCCPHYDGEPQRRPSLHQMIGSGELIDGIALDDGAGAHFIDGKLHQVVTSRPNAKGYRVERSGENSVNENQLESRYLL